MPLVPFGQYKPDVSDYEGDSSRNILNVLPQGDGYGPFPAYTDFTFELPGACRGAFYALRADGSIATFAATATRLYLLNSTDQTWGDVSRDGDDYSALSATAQWQFVQFNNLVIATQANDTVQVFNLQSSTEFDDLAGSPPNAAYASIVGRFVVLSGLLSNPYRIQWSGLNDPTNWTPGVNSSDFQDLPDGGIVRGVAGGENGTIFQDQAIRTMIYAPGSPIIFQIERIAQDMGLFAPYSLVRAGSKIFFYSAKGFYKIEPGSMPVQIGRERVDRTFFANLDRSNTQLFMGAADPRSSRVYWAYKSVDGSDAVFDTILGYDDALDRFFAVKVSGEYLLGISQNGLTLESLDQISASLDALIASLDSYATSVTPEIASFSGTHRLGFFRGTTLEAVLETAEQGTDGKRIFVNGFRPVCDAPSIFGSASFRDTAQAVPSTTTEAPINPRTGRCDLRKETRYSRMRMRIPAGTQWTFAAGVEPDISAGALQ